MSEQAGPGPGTVMDPKSSRDATPILEQGISVRTVSLMGKEGDFLPRYDSPAPLMKSKLQIEKKLIELEDQYLYLKKLTKTPFSADELKLKAEALRWVLGKQETL